MRKITADIIFPISQAPVPQGVVVVADDGQIVEIAERSRFAADELEYYAGAIVPGFVNTHCHLELSHMKGRVYTGTGLIPFIRGVVQNRNAELTEIEAAINAADDYMYEHGIVAVGDISNVNHTFPRKAASKIAYYTFVEFFDFMQDSKAEASAAPYRAVYDQLQPAYPHRKSAVPHAPYSVSPTLFAYLNELNRAQAPLTISIHNQETPPENQLFLEKAGGFPEFYGQFGVELAAFLPTQKTAIHYALEHLDPHHRTLFVHNTLTTKEDIEAAQAWSADVFWATCPNANLYIENRLPNYQHFLDTNARVTIGTDSLTSNWQLSVLEELKTIAKYQSYVPFETLLRWATLNGAQALGMEDRFGSIEAGKYCGLNLLDVETPHRFSDRTTVTRLV